MNAIQGRGSTARVYQCILGGKDGRGPDRAAAAKILDAAPGIARAVADNRFFTDRAVRYLAGPEGMRQFVDVGCGYPPPPAHPPLHESARAAAPSARVVYADISPEVVAHARALMDGGPLTASVVADVRCPAGLITAAEDTRVIDFDQPVVLVMAGLLHLIPGSLPAVLCRSYLTACAPGSWLVITHLCSDGTSPAAAGALSAADVDMPAVFRAAGEITRLFGGWGLVTPGLTKAHAWQRGKPPQPGDPRPVTLLAGVAVKPGGGS